MAATGASSGSGADLPATLAQHSDSDNGLGADDVAAAHDAEEIEEILSPEVHAERLSKAAAYKEAGNVAFSSGEYAAALEQYTLALEVSPQAERIVRSQCFANRAACHSKRGDHAAVVDDCNRAIQLDETYVKALLRRAAALELLEKLDDSLRDYRAALELCEGDNAVAKAGTERLPPLIEARNEKLKQEMLGQLKDLGNMFLSKFGMSTDNFKFDKDPNTGGYSVKFTQ